MRQVPHSSLTLLKTSTSSVWSKWDVWAGKQSISTRASTAASTKRNDNPGKIKRLFLRVKTRSDDLLVYFRENEDKKRVQKNLKYKFSMNFQYAYKCVWTGLILPIFMNAFYREKTRLENKKGAVTNAHQLCIIS